MPDIRRIDAVPIVFEYSDIVACDGFVVWVCMTGKLLLYECPHRYSWEAVSICPSGFVEGGDTWRDALGRYRTFYRKILYGHAELSKSFDDLTAAVTGWAAPGLKQTWAERVYLRRDEDEAWFFDRERYPKGLSVRADRDCRIEVVLLSSDILPKSGMNRSNEVYAVGLSASDEIEL